MSTAQNPGSGSGSASSPQNPGWKERCEAFLRRNTVAVLYVVVLLICSAVALNVAPTWGWLAIGLVATPGVMFVTRKKTALWLPIAGGVLCLSIWAWQATVLMGLGIGLGYATVFAVRKAKADRTPRQRAAQRLRQMRRNRRPAAPAQPSSNMKKLGVAVVVAAGIVVAFLTGRASTGDLQQQVNDTRATSVQLQQQLDELKKNPPVAPPQNGPSTAPQPNANGGVTLAGNPTSQQEALVSKLLASQGVTQFSYNVDEAWAASVTPGGDTFGDKPVFSEVALVDWMKNNPNDPRAQKVLEYFRACASHDRSQDALLFDPANYVAVQLHQEVQWNGNLAYTNGQVYNAGSTKDPAGAVAIFYVGPDTLAKNSLALCSVRGHCINPQEEVPSAVGSVAPRPNVTKPVGNGGECTVNCTPPHGGGCTEPNGCKPVETCETNPNRPECKPVENCTTHPNRPECKPPVEDCSTNPNQEKCKPVEDCKPGDTRPKCKPPVEDCKTNPNQEKCKPTETCETNPNRPECKPVEDCTTNPEKPGCKPDTCETNPNKPGCEQEPEKCEGVSLDGLCDTDPNASSGEVQDNDPAHVAPEPGYTPGDAEDVLGNQPHCIADCGGDSTDHGTIVDGSEDGGFAPGGGLDLPVPGAGGSGGNNPAGDGTPFDQGVDLGTSVPVDSPTSGETVEDTPDPFGGVTLPNADTHAAPQAAAVAPTGDTGAADESSTVQPAPMSDLGSALSAFTGGDNGVSNNNPAPAATGGNDLGNTVTSLLGAGGNDHNTFTAPSGYTGGSDGAELGSLTSSLGSGASHSGTSGMSTPIDTATSAFSSGHGAFQGVG